VQNNIGETSFFNNPQGPQNMWLFLCHGFRAARGDRIDLRYFYAFF